ncbi:RNA polymerase sigma factor [Flavivirga sp. 57AJ16]|uniref:RNA polymerase sigma factor n=1 Tax=Flavivirga sp. 57AJ16 TaxID=3025307 RepID=UPI002367023C|nr:RNA polymerase sigma factor [Flavivirga sp. 57AJ16]MDD7885027.1 RNA polymerase sigma factor [Flavivirga sp. 57AJ16]
MSLLNKFNLILVNVLPGNSKKDSAPLTDDELVLQIVETNNAILFGKLYDRYSKKVYSKCYSFSKDKHEAQDLAQDVFIKLFTKLGTYKAQSKFSTWLYSFTYNFLVNYKKQDTSKKLKERWERLNKYDYYLASEDDVDEDDLFELRASKLEKALELMEPADKALLLLKYQDNVSVKDIQAILNINESAVKMRLKRARIKLIKAHNKLKD